MAMYKVSVKVYKGPDGKTMFLPTLVRALGSVAMVIGIPCVLVGVLNIGSSPDDIGVKVAVGFLIAGILLTGLGIFLRGWSKHKAETSYLEALTKMEQPEQEQEQKTE